VFYRFGERCLSFSLVWCLLGYFSAPDCLPQSEPLNFWAPNYHLVLPSPPANTEWACCWSWLCWCRCLKSRQCLVLLLRWGLKVGTAQPPVWPRCWENLALRSVVTYLWPWISCVLFLVLSLALMLLIGLLARMFRHSMLISSYIHHK